MDAQEGYLGGSRGKGEGSLVGRERKYEEEGMKKEVRSGRGGEVTQGGEDMEDGEEEGGYSGGKEMVRLEERGQSKQDVNSGSKQREQG